jgi:TolB-like protein
MTEKIVQENGNGRQDLPVTDQQAALEPKPTSWTIRRSVIVAVLLLAAAAVMIYLTIVRSTDSNAVAGAKSMAVLPLKPIDPANRSDIFEIGIADSLIQRLSSIKGFVVRPLNATRKYTEIAQDPVAAGREQKVDYVLGSNYQLADGKIRITSQLFNVANGQIEDTFTVATDSANLFSAQDAIANDIGNRLLARFGSYGSEFRSSVERTTKKPIVIISWR